MRDKLRRRLFFLVRPVRLGDPCIGCRPQTRDCDSWSCRHGATLGFVVAAPRRLGSAISRFVDADGDQEGQVQRRFGDMASVFVVTFVRWRQLCWVLWFAGRRLWVPEGGSSSGPVMAGESESDKTTRSGNSGPQAALVCLDCFWPEDMGLRRPIRSAS